MNTIQSDLDNCQPKYDDIMIFKMASAVRHLGFDNLNVCRKLSPKNLTQRASIHRASKSD